MVQDSLVAALEKWPEQGIPDKPGAWLMTTAKRRAIDILRRDRRYREKLALLEGSDLRADAAEADDRLRLIFTCCHPALSQEAQVALTLRAVAGFTTAEIASAFLVEEPTVAQRIVRAKRKIVEANIPYRVPEGAEVAGRLDGVLSVLYLMFNEGYLSRGAQVAMRRDLAGAGRLLALIASMAGEYVPVSAENPEPTNAVRIDEGPGIRVKGNSRLMHSRIRRAPGSEMPGVPASVISAIFSPAAIRRRRAANFSATGGRSLFSCS